MWLDTLVDQVATTLKAAPPFVWVRDEPTQEDLDHIVKETEASRFDPLLLRKTMLDAYREGKAKLICRRGPFAKMLVLAYPNTSLPWNLFARIFQAFGPPPAATGHSTWRVVLYANPEPRLFPDAATNLPTLVSEERWPGHLNGGYAYPKVPSSVIVYRLEEAPRVLVHELLHAAGTDNMDHPEFLREALTESWAELFLLAIQALGSKRKAGGLWKLQSQWVADQNAKLMDVYGIQKPQDYPWRYTVARGEVFATMGLPLPAGDPNRANSLRFTCPQLTVEVAAPKRRLSQ